ncbi:hypothetical protein PpBr36_08504 [Pyricularia pennisetigena]|uniref:hypothetical protein n=1 Tax=Pyricularia pennisetigena TaxID=1578925 RepID=UPI001154C85C|nr:hypothetical protein PpBr36_08504 [Pyricularia pennisetigena]TLS24171.1 hypothetical protein PpBr36_08504 [Pyricularia pennisetigena]
MVGPIGGLSGLFATGGLVHKVIWAGIDPAHRAYAGSSCLCIPPRQTLQSLCTMSTPQAYTNAPPLDEKKPITMVRGGQVDAEAAHSYAIDPAAEARLRRLQDLRVLPMVFLMYFFTFLDRTNLGNAKVAGMEADLGLGTYGFNIGACLYYGVYFFADVPASLSVKRFGNVVLPLSCVAFGVVTLATAFITNQAGFYAMRILLGLTESFQFPGLSYVVSRYYRRREVTIRVAFFMLVAAGLAGVGLVSIYLFPADPSKTRIFNPEQRALAMARLFHDQPAIRDHKENITWGLIKRGVLTPNVLAGAWIYTCNQVSVQGLSIFTVTILRLNYPGLSTVQIQLLSAPPPIVGAAFALCMAYVAMKTRRHGLVIAACAGLNVIGYGIWLGSSSSQLRYAAIFLNTGGGFASGALVLSWTLANAAPDTVRNVANAAVSGLANIVGLERILRLFQSIAQIILGVPFLAITTTAWVNSLPSTVAFFSSLTSGEKPVVAAAAPLKVADTLLLLGDLKGKLALARRTVRLFWFLGSFQAAQQLYSTGGGLDVWLDVASRSFNGMYLILETVTMPDVVGTPHLRLFGPALSATLNLEAQRFWLLALVCAAASSCLKLLATYGQAAVPETGDGFGAKVGEKTKKNKAGAAVDKAGKEAAGVALARERSAKRRALLRKLAADVLDMAAPGVVVGWMDVDAGAVGMAMFVTTLLTSYDVWKKFA